MDPAVQQFLLAGLPLGVVSALVLTLAWWRAGRGERWLTDPLRAEPGGAGARGPVWVFPLVSALGFVGVHAWLSGPPGWPPVSADQWLAWIAGAALLAALVTAVAGEPRVPARTPDGWPSGWGTGVSLGRLGLRAGLLGAASGVSVLNLARHAWSAGQSLAWVGGTVALGLIGWWAVERLARRAHGPLFPAALWLWAALSGQVIVLGLYHLRGGVAATILAAAFGGAMVAAMVRPRLTLARGGVVVAAVLMPVLLLQGAVLGGSEQPEWVRVLLASAPILALLSGTLADWRAPADDPRARGAVWGGPREVVRLALVVVPVVVAVAAAVLLRSADAPPSYDY
jgi:hypothetical protein